MTAISDIHLAVKDAVVTGAVILVSSAAASGISYMVASDGGTFYLFIGLTIVGAVLTPLGAVQWRTGKPLAFGRRLPYSYSRLLLLWTAAAIFVGIRPWVVDRIWPR